METTNTFETTRTLTRLPSARRHVIRINNMTAKKSQYQKSSIMRSRELVTTPVKTLALFCNEYVPEHFPKNLKAVKYIFTINGQDNEVVPVNAQRDGKKIIRTTEYNSNAQHVIYLSEEIKSAVLTIIIQTPNTGETPYISNIKILAGGEKNV